MKTMLLTSTLIAAIAVALGMGCGGRVLDEGGNHHGGSGGSTVGGTGGSGGDAGSGGTGGSAGAGGTGGIAGAGGEGGTAGAGGSAGSGGSGGGPGTGGSGGGGGSPPGTFNCDYAMSKVEVCYSYSGLSPAEQSAASTACLSQKGASTPASCPTGQLGCCEGISAGGGGVTYGFCVYGVPASEASMYATACATVKGTWTM